MNEIRRKKRSKKRGKSKNKEFMDAALDAFIRDQSLQKWNEVEGLREGAEINVMQAVKSSSEFLVKGPYRKIWVSWRTKKSMYSKISKIHSSHIVIPSSSSPKFSHKYFY